MGEIKDIFLEAYNNHSDAIFRFCLFKLSDTELAKDMMQDTFAKAWALASRNNSHINSLKAVLYKIAGNLVIDEYRRRGRRPVSASLDVLHEDGFDPSVDSTDSMMDIADGSKAIKLISKIDAPYGEAVFMRYVQGLELNEMSEILGVSENTASVRVHRGIKILKKLFNHEE